MAEKEKVREFLSAFKEKKKIWGILYRDDRGKNTQTLADLEIRPYERDKTLNELEVRDYAQGPIPEAIYGGADLWVFGKTIKGTEVYIKISMGRAGLQAICISFHIAEYPMKYPYKNEVF